MFFRLFLQQRLERGDRPWGQAALRGRHHVCRSNGDYVLCLGWKRFFSLNFSTNVLRNCSDPVLRSRLQLGSAFRLNFGAFFEADTLVIVSHIDFVKSEANLRKYVFYVR